MIKILFLIILNILVFNGCTIGFKDKLKWNKLNSNSSYLGKWKEIKGNGEIVIKQFGNKIEITIDKTNKVVADLLNFNNINIVVIELPSKRFMYGKIKLLTNNKLIFQNLDISILKKLIKKSRIDDKLVYYCKEQVNIKNLDNDVILIPKYSSFEDCLVLNIESNYLSELIKANHNSIFNKGIIFIKEK